ncbi:hypothetical protein SLE2022_399020 [Rubroshorea leprosula]
MSFLTDSFKTFSSSTPASGDRTAVVSAVVVTAIAMSVTMAFLSCLLWHQKNDLPFTSNKKKMRKKPRSGVIDATGNTPLIHLNSLSQATGCEVNHLFVKNFIFC